MMEFCPVLTKTHAFTFCQSIPASHEATPSIKKQPDSFDYKAARQAHAVLAMIDIQTKDGVTGQSKFAEAVLS